MDENYFNDVVNSLNIDDMNILGILYDREANAGFKAIKNVEMFQTSGLSESTYRRIIYRLVANRFIEIIIIKKQNAFYITEYGTNAILKSLEGVTT